MVDITPGVNQQKAKAVLDFVDGPQEFASFDEPARAHDAVQPDSLGVVAAPRDPAQRCAARRRVVAVALRPVEPRPIPRRRPSRRAGRRRHRVNRSRTTRRAARSMSPLWDDFGAVTVPLTLVRGSTSPVVDDDDVAEARRRQPEHRRSGRRRRRAQRAGRSSGRARCGARGTARPARPEGGRAWSRWTGVAVSRRRRCRRVRLGGTTSIFSNGDPSTSVARVGSPMTIAVWIASVRSFGEIEAPRSGSRGSGSAPVAGSGVTVWTHAPTRQSFWSWRSSPRSRELLVIWACSAQTTPRR